MVNSIGSIPTSNIQSLRQKAVQFYALAIKDGPLDSQRSQTGATERLKKSVNEGQTIYQSICEITGTSLSQNPLSFLRYSGRGAEEFVLAMAHKGEMALYGKTPLTDMLTRLYTKVSGNQGWDASPP